MDTVAPLKKIRISGKRKSSHNADVNKYKNYRNVYNHTKRAVMCTYYMSQAEANKKNTKELWKLINSTISKQKNSGSVISHITVHGLKITNGQEIADSFANHYANVASSLASKIKQGKKNIGDYLSDIPWIVNSIRLKEVTQEEIEWNIDGLLNKMSSGCNNISNTLLKSLKTSTSYPLYIIFSQLISTGVFPDKMKEAEVVPLYKNKEMDKVINYHPISFLMMISKLLEKLMYKQIYAFLNKHNILFQSQYGFRKHHSCEQAIQELLGKILHAKEEGLQCMSIFLDLSKAFDTLDHSFLLNKLERHSIKGTAQDWFSSYSADCSLQAKVPVATNKVIYSKKVDISYGTTQGSCLGPLLFIVFCNNIHLLPMMGDLILFADDTTLFNKQKNQNLLEYSLVHDMEILSDWLRANKLSLNMSKTLLMHFWPKKCKLNVTVDGTTIPQVSSTRFLGVLVDEELSWDQHVLYVIEKIQSNKHLISLSRNLLPTHCLHSIY